MAKKNGKIPVKVREEPSGRTDAERIALLNRALRSIAEIVDTALRDDHRIEFLARREVEQRVEQMTDFEPVSSGRGESRSDAADLRAKALVPPYVS